jgi:hypothetical protein
VAAYVQAKSSSPNAWIGATSNGSTVPNAFGDPDIRHLALDAAPIEGNRLFLIVAYEDNRFPLNVLLAGWTLVGLVPGEPGPGDGSSTRWGLYTRVVGPGESANVLVAYNDNDRGITVQGIYHLVEYSGLGAPAGDALTWAGATLELPTVVSPGGLLVGVAVINPNYQPTWPAGWTRRTSTVTGEGAQSIELADQIVTGGSYDGTLTIGGSFTFAQVGINVASGQQSGQSQILIV